VYEHLLSKLKLIKSYIITSTEEEEQEDKEKVDLTSSFSNKEVLGAGRKEEAPNMKTKDVILCSMVWAITQLKEVTDVH
jgi:hypothetical protein